MPELPEVEVTKRGLAPVTVSRTLTDAAVRAPKLRDPIPDLKALAGLTLKSLSRRGKYLLWEFVDSDGNRKGTLVSHQGMSGVWRIWPNPAPAPAKHDHVDLVFESVTVRYTDPRRFGNMVWIEGDPLTCLPLSKLGVEPFEDVFNPDYFYGELQKTAKSIKEVLLEGSIVVGCGNIYCSETLYESGIHPQTPANMVLREKTDLLLETIRRVLERAIMQGGSTLRDFHGPDGADGYFSLTCSVYDRKGKPCRTCGTPIERIVQGSRATFFCPECQKLSEEAAEVVRKREEKRAAIAAKRTATKAE